MSACCFDRQKWFSCVGGDGGSQRRPDYCCSRARDCETGPRVSTFEGASSPRNGQHTGLVEQHGGSRADHQVMVLAPVQAA